jgi:two-component sensor histidine kinase
MVVLYRSLKHFEIILSYNTPMSFESIRLMLLRLFFGVLFAWPVMAGDVINIADPHTRPILPHGSLYVDDENLDFATIRNKSFRPIHSQHLNFGITTANIWLKFTFTNTFKKRLNSALVVRSTRLGHVMLYDVQTQHAVRRGLANPFTKEPTRFPKLSIIVPSHHTKTYYVKIHDPWNSILFSVDLQRHYQYHLTEQKEQRTILFLLGIMISLILYSLVLATYARDISYFYYGLYLIALLYQQSSYLGIHTLLMPFEYLNFDRKLALAKVGLLVFTSSLFAMHFLKTHTIMALHRIYQIGIVMGLAQIVFVGIVWNAPETLMPYTKPWALGFIGFNFLFSIFSAVAAIYYYQQGNKVARLYALGFSLVVIVYGLMAAGALGWSTLLYDHPNLVLYGTILEALILSLAFVDRYNILHQAKKEADQKFLDESRNREIIVQSEVARKTAQLKQALETKNLLLREVHHRVKNNLHVILSMIRLQRVKLDGATTEEVLISLENRINAIAKTYNLLLSGDDLEAIDMKEYIDHLLHDLTASLPLQTTPIQLDTNIDAIVPLRESVYVGLIINELVTNAYKYAFGAEGGTISVTLRQEGDRVTLTVSDSGKGFTYDPDSDSLGLKLIQTLARDQLRGTIETHTHPGTRFTVIFSV